MNVSFPIKVPILGQKQETTLRPLFDWVFCSRVEAQQVSAGGIEIVGSGERPYEEAEVVAVGPDSRSVKPGQRIQFIGRCPEVTVDGITYYLIRDALPGPGEIRYEERTVGEYKTDLPMHCAYIVCVLERETTLQ